MPLDNRGSSAICTGGMGSGIAIADWAGVVLTISHLPLQCVGVRWGLGLNVDRASGCKVKHGWL